MTVQNIIFFGVSAFTIIYVLVTEVKIQKLKSEIEILKERLAIRNGNKLF